MKMSVTILMIVLILCCAVAPAMAAGPADWITCVADQPAAPVFQDLTWGYLAGAVAFGLMCMLF